MREKKGSKTLPPEIPSPRQFSHILDSSIHSRGGGIRQGLVWTFLKHQICITEPYWKV